MKTTLIAIALIASSNAAAVEGFAPWETRAVVQDNNVQAPADAVTSRFAPWEDRNVVADAAARNAVVETPISGFRPWS